MNVFEFFKMEGGDPVVRSRSSGDSGGVCTENEDSSPCCSHASQGEGPDDEHLEEVLSELRAEAGLDVRAGPDMQGEELSWDTNTQDVNEDQSNTSTASPERHAPSTGDTHTYGECTSLNNL